jgi:purine catabolism regulator
MALTVGEVLALPVLAAGRPRVRVGGSGLDQEVRWVHVSELTEVAGTLGGGELILSTGMGLVEPGFDSRAYLRSLAEAGAVGLVVEMGQHVQTLPEDLVRAARSFRLPLVELAQQVRFVAVTEVVHARLLHEQYDRLRFSERVHEEFTALTLGSPTVAEVLERVVAVTGRAVVLEDLTHQAVSYAGGPGEEVLLGWGARSRRVPNETAAGGGPEGWVVTPVGPVGQRWGRLVVPERVVGGAESAGGGAGPDDDRDRVRLVLERAAEALTIVRLIDRDTRTVAEQARSGLLRDLVSSRRHDETELRARARALGLALRGVFVPVVAQVRDSSDAEGRDRLPGVEGPADVLAGVGADICTAALARAGLPGLVGRLAGGQAGVLLAAADRERAERAAARFATAAVAEAERLSAPPPVLATAEPANTLAAAGESLTEAVHVAQVAASMPGPIAGKLHRSADLGARGLLWWMRGDPRLQAFIEGQLGPILESGGSRADDDLSLLGAYLAANGSMTQLAERLHLSRPATYARVHRLEQRLGRRLSDPETRLSLHLALLAGSD